MKIAIEAQRIFRPKKHGMDFVALEMIRELQKIDKVNEYRIYVKSDSDRCLSETENFKIVELSGFGYPVWEQWVLPRAVAEWNPDILHCTSNTAPVFSNIKLVLTLHDIIFLEKGADGGKTKSFYQKLGRIYRRWVVPPVLKKATKIITVSKFEQKRITVALDLPADKLVAVYNGYSQHFYPRTKADALASEIALPERYFFFLGNTDPKKNSERTLRAFYEYTQQTNNDVKLLVADLKEEYISHFDFWKDEKFRQRVVLLGYVANKDLPFYYSCAELFLYPSLRESFGIPILEAMACGTPIITSGTSAMPEIAGSGAMLINPFHHEEIVAKMVELETNEKLAAQQVAYGLERVTHFSWKQTATEVLELYKTIV